MKRRDVATLIGALTALGTANAQFGGLGSMLGGGKGGGASVDGIILDFMILAKTSSICMCQLAYAFDKKTEGAQWQAKAKSIQNMSKPDEIGAVLTDIQKSPEAQMQGFADADQAANAYKKLSPEMQKFVMSALLAAGIGALKIVDIIKGIQSAKPSPMDIPKIAALKSPAEALAKALPVIWDKGTGMLKAAKVSPPTPDKDAKSELTSDGWPASATA
jgi:hypothetical protein